MPETTKKLWTSLGLNPGHLTPQAVTQLSITLLHQLVSFFQVFPGPLLGQVREEACPAKVQRELRLRRHQQHPGHGEERHSTGRLREQGHRGLVSWSSVLAIPIALALL